MVHNYDIFLGFSMGTLGLTEVKHRLHREMACWEEKRVSRKLVNRFREYLLGITLRKFCDVWEIIR